MKPWILVAALVMLTQTASPQIPQAEISNGTVRATIYLPSAESGYYRGTRFDWAGVVSSLKWGDHEYFGQWFEKYDPKVHDAIAGPVEEFLTGKDSSLGYDEAKPGETFVRIGVGAVRKPQNAAEYKRFETYEIVDSGRWTVNRHKDRIEFVHELKDTNGYAYVYRKTLRLGKDSMALEHSLKNTGRQPIATHVYNHNFFTMDRKTTGPDIVVQFPFEVKAARSFNGLAEARGREIAFLRPFEKGQTVFSEIEGFGATAASYDFRITNRGTGASVRITGDRPLVKVYFWSAHLTVCPEPYIDVSVEPGKESIWRINYQFSHTPPTAKEQP